MKRYWTRKPQEDQDATVPAHLCRCIKVTNYVISAYYTSIRK